MPVTDMFWVVKPPDISMGDEYKGQIIVIDKILEYFGKFQYYSIICRAFLYKDLAMYPHNSWRKLFMV